MRRLLLVCSGNICRSPMAVWIARHKATVRGLDLDVDSAGTLGIQGAPPHRRAVEVVAELGIGTEPHTSKGITAELVAWADDVAVMEIAHAVHIRGTFPEVDEHRVHLLGSFAGVGEIEDPVGAWTKGPYRRARDLVARSLDGYLDALQRGGPSPG